MFKVGDKGKTRGGLDYRVICVDAVGDYPTVALLTDMTGNQVSKQYTKTGFYYSDKESRYDLIKEPIREVRYGGVYASMEDECLYKVAAAAAASTDGYGYSDRVFEITFEDGKPVEARIVFVGDGE